MFCKQNKLFATYTYREIVSLKTSLEQTFIGCMRKKKGSKKRKKKNVSLYSSIVKFF